MDRVRSLKFTLWLLLGLAASVAVFRFWQGLGATTNLSDANPWGLWVGFDLSAVALAAGGFTLTACVYIFRLERFHRIVRLGVLGAFLIYIAFTVILLFELGLPWNIWHMTVFWNPHSPLFEVGWCVMLYLMVLALEFLPVPAEEFPRLAKLRAVVLKFRLPLVILGVGLSTLHQSSLGSLFLIMPYRVAPLWYSPILPILFLISAIALGLAMVIFENHVTAYLYRRKPECETLAPLGLACFWVLLAYSALRFGDLLIRHKGGQLITSGWRTGLFWTEIVLMAIIPIALFSIRRVRESREGQWTVAALVAFGVALNRVDVGGLAHLRPEGTFYLPAWTEVAISIGIVAASVLAFLFILEHFKIWEQRPADPDADPMKLPEFDPVGNTWLGAPGIASRTVYSMAFIVAAAVGFGFLHVQKAESRGIELVAVHQARGGDILFIDGNLDGLGVSFKHAEHEKREGGKESCAKCHHMNYPRDEATACSRCHYQMYVATDASMHDWHASPEGARLGCYQCHPAGQVRTAATAVHCDKCHKNLVPAAATIRIKQYQAVAYTDAMHRLCIGCHIQKAKEKNKPEMTRCAWCHKENPEILNSRDLILARYGLSRGSVVLPPPNIGKN